MPSPLSIIDRVREIMDSFYTGFPAAIKYYVGQKNDSVNYAGSYIVFSPTNESVIAPHISGAEIDGYSYEFTLDRVVTITAKCQSKTIENVSLMLSGLLAAIKLTNGPQINANINWDTQGLDGGVTRQNELATLNFDLRFPVPSLKSFLVTPETFETPVDFVDVLPDGYEYVVNANLEIPPFYASGAKEILT